MDLPFHDHIDSPKDSPKPETRLIYFGHSYNVQTGQHSIELSFSDGKTLPDRFPPDAPRWAIANHLQLMVDALRQMDALEPMPDEDG